MKKKSGAIDFPGTDEPPRPAKGLGAAGRRLWRSIQAEYQITDAGGVAHLAAAARAEDDIDRMRKIVKADGDILRDRFGQKKAHPLIAQLAVVEAVRRSALQALNLDVQPLQNGPGRPAGK